MDKRSFLKAATTAMAASLAPAAWADEKMVRVILPYSPGGIIDILSRTLAPSISETLNRPVVIDNRPGASGLIAIRAIQNAPADGSMWVMVQNISFIGMPYMQKVAKYSAARDFSPIAMMGDGPGLIYVSGDVPAKNMAEFIAWAKTRPGGVEAATSGPGGGSHTWTLLLARRAGINLLPVPYRGSAEMTTALMSGEAKIMISTATEALNSQVKTGRLRVLGITSDRPSPLAPGVPLVSDTVPGFVLAGWFSFFGAQSMPAQDVQLLSHAIKMALAEPGMKEKFASLFADLRYEDPAQLAATVQRTEDFYKKLVVDLNIEPT